MNINFSYPNTARSPNTCKATESPVYKSEITGALWSVEGLARWVEYFYSPIERDLRNYTRPINAEEKIVEGLKLKRMFNKSL